MEKGYLYRYVYYIKVGVNPSYDTYPMNLIYRFDLQMHRDENMYVPEMLFGHLLTGSNFDDDEKRLTGKKTF